MTGDEWKEEENCLRERNGHCESVTKKKTGREILEEAEMHEARLETLCGERVETQPTPLGAETEAAVGGR